jgi:hypothetical protein
LVVEYPVERRTRDPAGDVLAVRNVDDSPTTVFAPNPAAHRDAAGLELLEYAEVFECSHTGGVG